jgi:hypothetical protein
VGPADRPKTVRGRVHRACWDRMRAAPEAESWDGSSWADQKPPVPNDSLYNYFYGVTCHSSSSCVAVGSYANLSSDESVALVEDWTS